MATSWKIIVRCLLQIRASDYTFIYPFRFTWEMKPNKKLDWWNTVACRKDDSQLSKKSIVWNDKSWFKKVSFLLYSWLYYTYAGSY